MDAKPCPMCGVLSSAPLSFALFALLPNLIRKRTSFTPLNPASIVPPPASGDLIVITSTRARVDGEAEDYHCGTGQAYRTLCILMDQPRLRKK
jgi:hypothetical protein